MLKVTSKHMQKKKEKEEQEQDVCQTCGGTGEVSVPGYVYPGEPHMADIDTAPCPDCCAHEEDDYNPDDDY